MAPDTGSENIEEIDRAHVFDTWSRQRNASPSHVVGSENATYRTADGREFLDFGSQLVCANLGYSADLVVDAVSDATATTPYINPHATTEARALLGKSSLN